MSSSAKTVNASIQLSLGRFPVVLDLADSVKAAKKKIRFSVPDIAHVNLNSFHVNFNGTYFTDESKSLESYGVTDGAALHFIKKVTCAAAAVDTEKKVDE